MRANATQSVPNSPADCRVTVGGDTYTSQDGGRLISVITDEQVWGGAYQIVLDNADDALDAKTYEGLTLTLYFGFIGTAGSNLHDLYVEKQRFESREGKLLMSLICKDKLVKTSLFKGTVGGSVWNHPWQAPAKLAEMRLPVSGELLPAALQTAIAAQYDKTAWYIIQNVIAASTGGTVTLTDDDGLIQVEKPLISAYDVRDVIKQALDVTDSYICCSGSGFQIIQPSAHAVAYSFSVGNTFFSNAEERAAVIPNTIIYHGIKSDNTLLTTESYHGVNAASIALLGAISEHWDYDYTRRENSSTQAQVDSKADRRIAKLLLGLGTGTIVAPMHCSLELLDKVSVVDDRYTPTKTITGYVFAMQREYNRGVYRITVQLGGIEKGYSPEGIPEFLVSPGNPPPPVLPIPADIPWETILPKAIQGFTFDGTFSSSSQVAVACTGGTVKFYDGTTQAIAAWGYNLPNSDITYVYFDLDDASPNVLKTVVASSWLSVFDEKIGLLCVVQKGSTASINANYVPSTGKQPLITPDLILMAGLKSYVYPDGTQIQGIFSTEVQAGYMKLTAQTVKSGQWYAETGIILDAAAGMKVYGGVYGLRTYPTYGDAVANTNIQCYVGTDGKICAGGGSVKLDADGIHIDSIGGVNILDFLYNTSRKGYIACNSSADLLLTSLAGDVSVVCGYSTSKVSMNVGYVYADGSGLKIPTNTGAAVEGMLTYEWAGGSYLIMKVYASGAWRDHGDL